MNLFPMSSLNFIGSDPGAVKYGNFINYYKFHPAKDRLMGFPTHIWRPNEGQKFCCLDVGCNSGELTQALWEFISKHIKSYSSPSVSEDELKMVSVESSAVGNIECFMLAMDLDHILITRAIESNQRESHISYVACNFMNEDEVVKSVRIFCDEKLQEEYHLQCFDAVFLLSVTMWIHLNYGDDGFRKLLQRAASLSRNLVIVEPQLWKCYTAANRRCTRSGGEGFSLLSKLKLRGDAAIETELDRVLTESHFRKIDESEKLKWDRKILFYQRCSS